MTALSGDTVRGGLAEAGVRLGRVQVTLQVPSRLSLLGIPAGAAMSSRDLTDLVHAPWVGRLDAGKRFRVWFAGSSEPPFALEPGRGYVLFTYRAGEQVQLQRPSTWRPSKLA